MTLLEKILKVFYFFVKNMYLCESKQVIAQEYERD